MSLEPGRPRPANRALRAIDERCSHRPVAGHSFEDAFHQGDGPQGRGYRGTVL